jgi:hypothetical protein
MMPFHRRILHLAVIVTAVFKRAWERIEPLLRSRAAMARRASGRIENLKRKEGEMERIDRLRNPDDYRCR